MKQVIYIEGPDACGKSTLVSAIQRKGDLVIHNGRYESPAKAYETYIKQLQDFTECKHQRLILDRGVLSEVVYGQVIRGDEPDPILLKVIIDMIQDFEYDIIVCLPPFGQTVIKWAQRLDEEYVNQFEQYVAIYEMFQRLPSEIADILVHDYTKNHQEVIHHVNRK